MRLSKSKALGDPKSNKSIQLVFQAIQYYEPALFLIENLPRLLSLISKEMLTDFFKNYKLIFTKEAFLTSETPKYQEKISNHWSSFRQGKRIFEFL